MDYCSTRKYSDYTGSSHPMASRTGVDAVLSGGPPNRMAPNVTVVAGHRHQQALRYQEHQHRLAALHSSEGLYQQQQHGFDRYLSAASYANYHPSSSYGAAALSYGNLGRRDVPASYLNYHTPHPQLSHHLYHPPHYDGTYNGRMIGGAGTSASTLSYHPYREGYEHQQPASPSSVLHYTARNSAFQYANTSHAVSQQQREYLHYYPYHPTFLSEQSYSQHNLHSINGLQGLSPNDEGRTKRSGQHFSESEASYAQQQHEQNLPSLSSMGITMIASPMASGSTTTDSGISGSSRCGSTPISMATTSTSLSGEYSVKTAERSEEGIIPKKEHKDGHESQPERQVDDVENEKCSTKGQQFSPYPSNTKLSSSPDNDCEKTMNDKQCASNRKPECPTPSTPALSTPERCGTVLTRPKTTFQSPLQYQSAQIMKWSPNLCETHDASTCSPTTFNSKPFSPNLRKKYPQIPFKEQKNRIVECDLIPSKKSKRNVETIQADEVREEIRNIKPLPGFQQAFGTTEIGRFFETFLNIPSSPYDYESEADTLSPQPWEIENSVDGSHYDVQISASLQSMYKSSLGDKNYLNGIKCNGY